MPMYMYIAQPRVFTNRGNPVEFMLMIKALLRASEAATISSKDYGDISTQCNVRICVITCSMIGNNLFLYITYNIGLKI